MYSFLMYVFFFFKQKTAYEMRISDWSSDVCSSDLLAVREFLHQYLTLSRCDLFFADKAILIEGTSERLLLPSMIRKTDEAAAGQPQLSSQYLTVMEVGGDRKSTRLNSSH